MRDEGQDGDRLLRAQTEKTSSWCTKWIPNLTKQCCTQTVPRGSRTKLPLWSESLIDGWSHNSVAKVSSGLLPPAGILGSLKYPYAHGCPSAFQPPPLHLLFVWSLCSLPLHGGTVDSFTQRCVFTIFFQEMNYLTAHFFCQTWWKLAWEFRAYTCWGWPTGKQTHANNRFLSASYKLATTSAGTETAPSFWPCHEPSRLNTLRWPLSWKPWSPGLSTVLFPNLSFKSGLCLERCGWTGIALWPPASSGDGWTGNIYLTCYKVITAGFLQAICRKKTLNQGNIDST